jgi:hypothetical protein
MRLRKTLAYGDGEIKKPGKWRVLEFAAIMPLLATCAARAIPAGGTVPAVAPQAETPMTQTPERATKCGSGLGSMLEQGERVTESVCRFGREYVMTSTSLLIVTRERENILTFDPISLRLHASRTDMQGYMQRGIVDWEPAEDAVYILMRDRMLIALPNEGMGATVPAYEMPFETAGLGRNRMAYHSGFIFIAPLSGNAIVISFADGLDSRYLRVGPGPADTGFFERNGRLFFGKRGMQETAITVGGSGVQDVSVGR